MNSYQSTINIYNSTIHNINTDNSILVVIESNITITNLTSYNLHTSNLGEFIQLSFGSQAVLEKVSYENSTMEFIEGLSSYLTMIDFIANQIDVNQYLIA